MSDVRIPEAQGRVEIGEQGPENVPFKTRARTVDHLGRGQIADTPTAVSELWKNAWDAYSTQVSLNIFDGDPICAAVFDDGVGMSAADFTERWLVIGTESKVDGPPPPPPPWFKGKSRPRQGEKGIGRLSAAFLAPAVLVVSRRDEGPYSAVLVDWRLFENPFLSLDEIVLPVRTFTNADAILSGLPEMAQVVLSNLGTSNGDGLWQFKDAWTRSGEDEVSTVRTIAEGLVKFWSTMPIGRRHLDEWPVLSGLAAHGTALFLLGAHHELSLWVQNSHQDQEVGLAKQRLTDILTGFTDSLSEYPVEFDYEVLVYRGPSSKRVLSSTDTFDLAEFRDLEHTVEGAFDADGVFTGRIRAFGKDVGERVIPPNRSLPRDWSSRPGPFSFAIGTFEQVALSSTHNSRRHRELMELVDLYGGVRVYRDELRVMPYGSTEADFFSLEEQRQKHAGRYFWAHRRSFGRLAFTRAQNPNLRDKAGREGLVENQASRQLRLLVQGLLIKLARDHFGTAAPERAERIAEAQTRNVQGKKAAEQNRKLRQSEFRNYFDDATKRMPQLAERARSIAMRLDDGSKPVGKSEAAVLRGEIERSRAELNALRPVEVPANLGKLEDRYRLFRDELDDAAERITLSDNVLRDIEAEAGAATPREVVRAAQDQHRNVLNALLDQFQQDIREGFKAATSTWTSNLVEDRERFDLAVAPLVRDIKADTNLADLLSLLDLNRREIESELLDRYRPLVRNVQRIAQGIDVGTALSSVDDDREELERRLRDLNAVAQLGITVEIIGHELEALDSDITRNFEALPTEVRSTPAYANALAAHRAMTERLRFLSPLQLAGARLRETITGNSIADYIERFFGPIFPDNGIALDATPAFRAIRFTELRSRIYPVFINLVNNAIYWVARSPKRIVRLDYVDGKVVVADSGPGVDKDDVGRLFQLFYSRRPGGRGVGLYLCRVNLEAGRHTIRYATEADPHVLAGANFILELRGLADDA